MSIIKVSRRCQVSAPVQQASKPRPVLVLKAGSSVNTRTGVPSELTAKPERNYFSLERPSAIDKLRHALLDDSVDNWRRRREDQRFTALAAFAKV